MNNSWGNVSLDQNNGFKFIHFHPVHGVNIEVKNTGDYPYITRTAINNGLNGFINKNEIANKFVNKGNCISFGAESSKFFYQPTDFVAGNKMYGIYHPKLTQKSGIILIAILTKALSDSFAYGFGMIPDRIIGKVINMPMTDQKSIDFKMLETIYDKLTKNLSHTSKTKNKISSASISLNDRKWKQFVVKDILTVDSGVRLTKENMVEGNIPFVGATSRNNGITNWVSNTNKSLDKNVLGINYNGSVVDNFYHPYQAIFSDDVKRVHIKDDSVIPNVYKYLFLKAVFLQCKAQYQYGYKFDGTRMKNQKITLPVTDDNKPDWQFMEDYIKSLPNGDLI